MQPLFPFVKWYYREGEAAAEWLSEHPGFKPLVRAGLIVPVSVAKLVAAGKWSHHLAALLIVMGCFAFAFGAGKHEGWKRRKTAMSGFVLAFLALVMYGIVMTPDTAQASTTWPENFNSEGVGFFYEDHIGRPVILSQYDDYDSSGSYFKDNDILPYFQAVYKPFGQVYNDFNSAGVTIGDPSQDGIVWEVPFRFPGQYQDPEDELYNNVYYNWHRYYMPEFGRYNRADPLLDIVNSSWLSLLFPSSSIIKSMSNASNIYSYAFNNPISFYDISGLITCPPCHEVEVDHDFHKFMECMGRNYNAIITVSTGVGCIAFTSGAIATTPSVLISGGFAAAAAGSCGTSGKILGTCLGESAEYHCVPK